MEDKVCRKTRESIGDLHSAVYELMLDGLFWYNFNTTFSSYSVSTVFFQATAKMSVACLQGNESAGVWLAASVLSVLDRPALASNGRCGLENSKDQFLCSVAAVPGFESHLSFCWCMIKQANLSRWVCLSVGRGKESSYSPGKVGGGWRGCFVPLCSRWRVAGRCGGWVLLFPGFPKGWSLSYRSYCCLDLVADVLQSRTQSWAQIWPELAAWHMLYW